MPTRIKKERNSTTEKKKLWTIFFDGEHVWWKIRFTIARGPKKKHTHEIYLTHRKNDVKQQRLKKKVQPWIWILHICQEICTSIFRQ